METIIDNILELVILSQALVSPEDCKKIFYQAFICSHVSV